jgi:hypothetical protein
MLKQVQHDGFCIKHKKDGGSEDPPQVFFWDGKVARG